MDIKQPTHQLAHCTVDVVNDLRRAAAALHVMCYPVKAEEVRFILAKCRAARRSLAAFMDSLEFNSDPETEEVQVRVDEDDEDDSPV
jgi:hypothetical protein